MTLENSGSISIPREQLFINAKEIDREKLPFVYGKVHKGEFYFTNKESGISHFDKEGNLIKATKIAIAVKPWIQEFLDDSSYLIASRINPKVGIWDKYQVNPKKYIALNIETYSYSMSYDRFNDAVCVFTSTSYFNQHEYHSGQESLTLMYLYELSNNLESNGKIIREIKGNREDVVFPILGCRMADGRTFALSSNSKLLEYNKDYEYVFSFDVIDGFKGQIPGEAYSRTLDVFEHWIPLPIYNSKYLLAVKNHQTENRILSIWNIESRKFESSFEIGGKVLIDADEDYIYLLDDIDEENAKIGKYSISFEEDNDSYLSMLNLENPFTKELYSLASVLPAFEDQLCVIFTSRMGDCVALTYIFEKQEVYHNCPNDFPQPFVCYTEEDPVIGTSYLNSSRLGYDEFAEKFRCDYNGSCTK